MSDEQMSVIPHSWLCTNAIVPVTQESVAALVAFARAQIKYCKDSTDRIEQLEAQLKTAKAEGMEEAAKICDSIARSHYGICPDGPSSTEEYHKGLAAEECFVAIRTAKAKLLQPNGEPV